MHSQGSVKARHAEKPGYNSTSLSFRRFNPTSLKERESKTSTTKTTPKPLVLSLKRESWEKVEKVEKE